MHPLNIQEKIYEPQVLKRQTEEDIALNVQIIYLMSFQYAEFHLQDIHRCFV